MNRVPPPPALLPSDTATSSVAASTAVDPPTDHAVNHADTPRDHVAIAAPSTPQTQAKSTTETTATTPIRKAATTPSHSSPSKRIRNFSPFRRRRSSNNPRQSNPAAGALGDEMNSNKKNNDDSKKSTRPGGTSRTRSLSGGLLLLGRQLRFNQSGQGQGQSQQEQQQQQQQRKGDQELGQMMHEKEEREFKERRRHSLFALPLSMSLPRSMSASNTQGIRKTTRMQTNALSQPLKQPPARARTYANMNRRDDPWGWGEPPADSAVGGQIGGGRRLMSDSSAVTVPARLGVLPSPPEAMFPAGVRERMGSPVEEHKPEVLEKVKGEKDEERVEKREDGGTDKDREVNDHKFGDKAQDSKSGRERKDAAYNEGENKDFTMSGIWVKGRSVTSPIEEGDKGTGNGYFESVAHVQQQDDNQSFLGDLEGSKSRYERMNESDSDLKNEMPLRKSEEQVQSRDVGLVVLNANRLKINDSGERVLSEKNEQSIDGNPVAGPVSSNPFLDALDSEHVNNYEPTPMPTRHLTIANPEIPQSESLRSPVLSVPWTNSAMTSPALSFHTATDGSVSQLETDLSGGEQAARIKEMQDKEESTTEGKQESQDSVSQTREDESRAKNGHRGVSPGLEQLQTGREVFQPATTLPENDSDSRESNVPPPAPKPIYFKTNSTYYKPAGILAASSQARAPRLSNSSEKSVERSHPVASTESNDSRPGLKPKITASDIFKALKNASGGAGTRSATSGRDKRRASIAGSVPMDPRRSPDAPPVPAINPAFLKGLHDSDGQNGPRRAVTDSVALAQDQSSKRKSLTRVGDLFRRLGSKGRVSPDATINNTNEQLPKTPTNREKRRSIAFMNRRSYTGSPNDRSTVAPTSLGLDRRRASMPASVPTQNSWQSDLTTLPVEAGRFGSTQYWEDMYRTSGLALYQKNVLPQQTRPHQQRDKSSERKARLHSKFHNSGNIKGPGPTSDSSRSLGPHNPQRASGQGVPNSTTEIVDAYSNVTVRGRAVTPPHRGSAMMQTNSYMRDMTPPLPTPPQAPALNLVPGAIPAPSFHSASMAFFSPAPLMGPWTSTNDHQWQWQFQQQQQQKLAPGGDSSRYSQGVSQADKSPIMHAASYPGMEWVPDFYDES